MIYLCGDTHGDYDIKKVHNWYNKNVNNLTEDDILIQLGDWGAMWYNHHDIHKMKKDQELQLKWVKKKFTLLVVPGNHENYNLIEKLPIVEKFGGKVRELKPINLYNRDKDYGSIYLLERGEIYTINGKTFLAMGGAKSQDIAYRTLNEDYWEGELWSREDEKNCLDNLDKHNWEVDYVIAHTCPNIIAEKLLYRMNGIGMYSGKANDPVGKFFQFLIKEGLEFKSWHFGHFHCDEKIENYQCYYNKIGELI